MPADDERPKLRLKNGSEVDARSAYVDWRMLFAEQDLHPNNVQSLIALARGDPDSVSKEVVAELRERHRLWFARDGTLEPIVRDVLLSAYRDTPEGVVIVNPFELTNQRDADTFSKIQRRDDRLLSRLFGLGDDPPGHSR